MNTRSYRKLEVWQLGMDLAESAFKLAQRFPTEHRFGLTSQFYRSVVSVPSNVAEGYARLHRAEYVHHLAIARGSLAEAETQLIIAVRAKLVSRAEALPVWNLAQEVGKRLNALITSLRN